MSGFGVNQDLKIRFWGARTFPLGIWLQTPLIIWNRFESLIDESLNNVIEVRPRVCKKGREFIVIGVNREWSRLWDKNEIYRIAEYCMEERL